MKKRKRCLHKSAQQTQYDTGLHCLNCKAELHISAENVEEVVRALREGGIVVMVCVMCGWVQAVRRQNGAQQN